MTGNTEARAVAARLIPRSPNGNGSSALFGNGRIQILLLAWLAYVGFYLCRRNFSVIIPLLIHEEQIPKAAVAAIVFAFSCAYAVGQFVIGPLADRCGARPVVFAGMLISSCATAAMGFSKSWHALLAWQVVNGLAQACGWSGLIKLMAGWFQHRGRGVVMAWWSTSYAAGGFVSTLVATFAMSSIPLAAGRWRPALWIPALLLVGIAVAFFRFTSELPTDSLVDKPQTGAGPRNLSALETIGTTIRNPAVMLIASAYFFIKLLRYSFFFWLPLYLTDALLYESKWAGYTSSMLELAGIGGVLLAGYASDKIWHSKRLSVASFMLAALAVACFFQQSFSLLGPFGIATGIALLGIFTYGPDTLIAGAATQDSTSWDSTGTAAGFVDGVGSLGQLLSPILVNASVTYWGWSGFFRLAVAVAIIGSLILAFGAKKLRL
jgi:MFS transporter, OPA family, sugar phosphate sensor protein UhpC